MQEYSCFLCLECLRQYFNFSEIHTKLLKDKGTSQWKLKTVQKTGWGRVSECIF